VKAVRAAVSSLLEKRHASLIVVQGDTSTAMGAAMAAFAAEVPVAHVEAGLRTFDPREPWPEEEYRTAIDADADLLFAPTEIAAANLRREARTGRVFVTGNTGIDALLQSSATTRRLSARDDPLPRLLVGCHRRENWGHPLRSLAAALRRIGGDGAASIDVLLHPNRYLSRRLERLLGGHANIELIAPCSHDALIQRMRRCDLMLSDSGGVQEEAPALGVPLLVLRDKTERPEGILHGSARLVGTDAVKVEATVRCLLADAAARRRMAEPKLLYGDGRAAPRIAEIIGDWVRDSRGSGAAKGPSGAALHRAGA
jgi:UDP-N-acetylglucosamine 2-epimerase (non-hydrolysing)